MRLNMRYSSFFEVKFNRKPKQWDIDSLIVLYRKAQKRHQIRRQNMIDCQNKILELGYDMVFYKNKDYVNYIQFEIKDDEVWNCSGIVFDDNDSDIEKRNKKLYYLIDTEQKFELGEEYKETRNLYYNCFCQAKVFNVLCDLIIENIIKPKYPKHSYPSTTILVKVHEFDIIFKWDQYHFKYDSMIKETITI